jgi:hypothetical protein
VIIVRRLIREGWIRYRWEGDLTADHDLSAQALICSLRAQTTLSLSLPPTRTSITNRELPSTRVATWVLREPAKRSTSQCPGTALSSASGGRSRMETASLICPRGCPLVEAWRPLRIIRLERR